MRNDQFLSAIASHSWRFTAGCLKKKATHQDCLLYWVIEEVAEKSIQLGLVSIEGWCIGVLSGRFKCQDWRRLTLLTSRIKKLPSAHHQVWSFSILSLKLEGECWWPSSYDPSMKQTSVHHQSWNFHIRGLKLEGECEWACVIKERAFSGDSRRRANRFG